MLISILAYHDGKEKSKLLLSGHLLSDYVVRTVDEHLVSEYADWVFCRKPSFSRRTFAVSVETSKVVATLAISSPAESELLGRQVSESPSPMLGRIMFLRKDKGIRMAPLT